MITYTKDEDEELVIPVGLGPVVCDECSRNDENVFYSLDYIAVHSVEEVHVKAYAAYFTDFTPDANVTGFETEFKAPVVSADPTEPTEEERDDSYFIWGCTNKPYGNLRFGVWIGHRSDLHVNFGSDAITDVVYTDNEIHFTEGVKIKAWRDGSTYTVEVNDDPETRKSAIVEDLDTFDTLQVFGRKGINGMVVHSAAGTEIHYIKLYGQDGLVADFWPYLVNNPYEMTNFRFLYTRYNGDCITRRPLKPYATRDGYVDGELDCPQNQF